MSSGWQPRRLALLGVIAPRNRENLQELGEVFKKHDRACGELPDKQVPRPPGRSSRSPSPRVPGASRRLETALAVRWSRAGGQVSAAVTRAGMWTAVRDSPKGPQACSFGKK